MRAVIAVLACLLGTSGARAAEGEALFNEFCSACHQKGGIGTVGLAPPLISSVLQNARMTNASYVPLVILNGLSGSIEAAGQHFVSAMPAQPQLPDDTLASIANYVLGTLNPGEGFKPLDAAQVASLRMPKVGHAELRKLRGELEK